MKTAAAACSRPPLPRASSACLFFGGLAIAAACAGCAPGDQDWCGPVDGAEVVLSTGAGLWEREGRTAGLEELWRAGGLREGEELVLPTGAAASPDGRLAIADFRLAEVLVVGPDGAWQGPWSEPGRGPGEISLPVAVNWRRAEGILAVFDFGSAKVLFFADGRPLREVIRVSPAPLAPVLMAGAMAWAGVQPDGGVLIQPEPFVDPSEPGRRLEAILRVAPGAEEEDTLAVRPTPALGGSPPFTAYAAPGWPRLVAAVGTDGAIVLGGLDARYRLLMLDGEGRVRRVMCREAAPVGVSDREVRPPDGVDRPGDWEARFRDAPRPDSLAPYGRVFPGASGRLWVQRERPSPAGHDRLGVPGARYDVFAEDGAYLGEVQAPARARLQAAAGDTVWAFEIGELDETWVVAYRLRFAVE